MAASVSVLGLNNDVLLQICEELHEDCPIYLATFSATCQRLRILASSILFRRVSLPTQRVLSWDALESDLSMLEQCSAVKSYTQRFTLKAPESSYEPRERDRESRARDPALRLLRFLHQMKRLHHLAVHIHWLDLVCLHQVAVDNNIDLPSVKSITAGTDDLNLLASLCPNLEALSSIRWDEELWHTARMLPRKLLKVVDLAPTIRHMELTATWTIAIVEELLEGLPNLSSLNIRNSYPHRGDSLRDMIPIIARFKMLKSLIMAPLNHHVSFSSPGVGNLYLGAGAREREIQIRAHQAQLEKEFATKILTQCPSIEDLWIGNVIHATVVREEKSKQVVDVHMSQGYRLDRFNF